MGLETYQRDSDFRVWSPTQDDLCRESCAEIVFPRERDSGNRLEQGALAT